MIIEVWEVYAVGSPNPVLFLDEEAARLQNIILSVDIMQPAEVDLDEEEIIELKAVGYLFL